MEKVTEAQKAAGHYEAFNLASLLTSYPDEIFTDELTTFMELKELSLFCSEKTIKSWDELKPLLDDLITEKSNVDDIRSDYIDIFDRGRSQNSLYETEYGKERVMAKTNVLADLAGFYNAFGLNTESDDVIHEMPDHISVELEFYGYLIFKQVFLKQNKLDEGVEVVLDARKKFLEDHIGRFAKSIAQRPGVIENNFFSKVFNWVDSLIDHECRKMEISPETVEWISTKTEDDAVGCESGNCGITKL